MSLFLELQMEVGNFSITVDASGLADGTLSLSITATTQLEMSARLQSPKKTLWIKVF
jgi:hypothetical protein